MRLHCITENWYGDCLQKPCENQRHGENTVLRVEDESEDKAFTCKPVTSHQNVVYPEIITQTNCIYAYSFISVIAGMFTSGIAFYHTQVRVQSTPLKRDPFQQ